MTQTMDQPGGSYEGWAGTFFGVVARSRTWLNLVYLILAFPLGLLYFVLLVVGLSVGISLVIIWVGIPILLLLITLWRLLGDLERGQARWLLGVDLESPGLPWSEGDGFWAKIRALLASRTTWLDLLFLFLKFPMGIVSFVLTVTAIALVGGFIGAPILQAFDLLTIGGTQIDSWPLAIALVPVGVLALFVSLHVLNGWAWVSARLAEALLTFSPAPAAQMGPRQPGMPPQPQGMPPQPQGWPQAPQGWPPQQAPGQAWQQQQQPWPQQPAQPWPQQPAQPWPQQPQQPWPQQQQPWPQQPAQPQQWPQAPQDWPQPPMPPQPPVPPQPAQAPEAEPQPAPETPDEATDQPSPEQSE